MQYSIVGNDIALIMHYRALLKRSVSDASLGLKGLLAIKFVDVNLFSWGNSLELQKHRKHH